MHGTGRIDTSLGEWFIVQPGPCIGNRWEIDRKEAAAHGAVLGQQWTGKGDPLSYLGKVLLMGRSHLLPEYLRAWPIQQVKNEDHVATSSVAVVTVLERCPPGEAHDVLVFLESHPGSDHFHLTASDVLQ
jgi:hypothetical protein